MLPAFAALKAPTAGIQRVENGVVRRQVSGDRRASARIEIGRAGYHCPANLGELAGDENRVRNGAGPDRKIIRLGDHVHLTIGKANIELDKRIEKRELRQ